MATAQVEEKLDWQVFGFSKEKIRQFHFIGIGLAKEGNQAIVFFGMTEEEIIKQAHDSFDWNYLCLRRLQ